MGSGEDTVLVTAFEAEWKFLGRGVGSRAFQRGEQHGQWGLVQEAEWNIPESVQTWFRCISKNRQMQTMKSLPLSLSSFYNLAVVFTYSPVTG